MVAAVLQPPLRAVHPPHPPHGLGCSAITDQQFFSKGWIRPEVEARVRRQGNHRMILSEWMLTIS